MSRDYDLESGMLIVLWNHRILQLAPALGSKNPHQAGAF